MKEKESLFSRMASSFSKWWAFVSKGVWMSRRNTFRIRLIKTLNLSVTSFLDRDIQTRAAWLTFNTLLAIVPFLALLLAISRGFGLQDLLRDQFFSYFPAQKDAIETTINVAYSYLGQSTQGVFVGIGIIVLLYTLISLLSSIEEAFNFIWDVRKERSLYQKITDYIAISLLIPFLIILAAGISLFMSTVFQSDLRIPFLTPLWNLALDLFPLFLMWLAFTISFYLIPNTRVNFKYAAIAGFISAVGFTILMLIFLNSQIYVTKYNAMYGSFAFFPLLLLWLQFSWVILLSGATLNYSMQNVFAYNYMANPALVSTNYMRKVALIVASIVVRRFAQDKRALTCNEISQMYDLPVRLVSSITTELHSLGIFNYVNLTDDEIGLAPAYDISQLSAGKLLKELDSYGDSDFIPTFQDTYREISDMVDSWEKTEWDSANSVLLKDIEIPLPPDKKDL